MNGSSHTTILSWGASLAATKTAESLHCRLLPLLCQLPSKHQPSLPPLLPALCQWLPTVLHTQRAPCIPALCVVPQLALTICYLLRFISVQERLQLAQVQRHILSLPGLMKRCSRSAAAGSRQLCCRHGGYTGLFGGSAVTPAPSLMCRLGKCCRQQQCTGGGRGIEPHPQREQHPDHSEVSRNLVACMKLRDLSLGQLLQAPPSIPAASCSHSSEARMHRTQHDIF